MYIKDEDTLFTICVTITQPCASSKPQETRMLHDLKYPLFFLYLVLYSAFLHLIHANSSAA